MFLVATIAHIAPTGKSTMPRLIIGSAEPAWYSSNQPDTLVPHATVRQRELTTNKIDFPFFPPSSPARRVRQKAIKHPTDEITAKQPMITLDNTEDSNDTGDNTTANIIHAIMNTVEKTAWARITRNSDTRSTLTHVTAPHCPQKRSNFAFSV